MSLNFQDNDQDKFFFESFDELPNITHLELSFEFNQKKYELNEKILTNIDIYLPKLQYLNIRFQIITDEEGVTQMTESLSKLSRLQSIDLWVQKGVISELMKAKIVEKCRKIRNIHLF